MLSKVLLAIVALVALLLVVGLVLPSTAHVERSVVIDRPACTVFTLVNGYGRFNEWSPWAEKDPNTRYTYEGPATGVGAKMSWESEDRNVGVGNQEIVASEPFSSVESKLDFGPEGMADAFFRLSPEGTGTKVVWGFDTDFGWSLIGRYFGLFMDSMIGKDYEAGLASLKTLAESLPSTDWCDLGAEVVEVEPVTIAYASGAATQDPEAIGVALGAAYGQVVAFLAKNGLEQAGAPLSIARVWDDAGNFEFDAGIPIAARPEKEIPADSPVQVGETYGGKVVKAVHKGPYEGLNQTYEKLEAYFAAHGLGQGERPWESYVSDPGNTAPEELETVIYWPIKS